MIKSFEKISYFSRDDVFFSENIIILVFFRIKAVLLSTCRNGKSQIQQVNDCGDTRWVNYGTACTATNDVKCRMHPTDICYCNPCVEAGEVTGYGSTTSAAKDDANAKAQTQANAMECLTAYYNDYVSHPFTRDNCGSNCTGSTVTAYVSANSKQFFSCNSKEEANDNALNYLKSGAGQSYANEHGTCTCLGSIGIMISTNAYSLEGKCTISGPTTRNQSISSASRQLYFRDLPHGTYTVSFSDVSGRCTSGGGLQRFNVVSYTRSLTVSDSNNYAEGSAEILGPC